MSTTNVATSIAAAICRRETSTPFVVQGIIRWVIDLTDTATQGALCTTVQEMTGLWATGADPPAQNAWPAAFDSGHVAAIQYGSAKNPGQKNLVVSHKGLAFPLQTISKCMILMSKDRELTGFARRSSEDSCLPLQMSQCG